MVAAWQRGRMSFYSRPQLMLLLVLIATAGVGVGVGHWRRTHPEMAERLEQLDRAPAEPAVTTAAVLSFCPR
jgi:hypothetical protein